MSFASDIGRMVVDGPKRPLNEEETMVLLHLTMMCEEPVEEQIKFYRMVCKESQAMGIMDYRISRGLGDEVKFSPPAVIWLSTLCSRPSDVVLLVAVLAYLREQGGELTLNSLFNRYFINGIPSRIGFDLAWNAQKVNNELAKTLNIPANGPDNCLDYKEAWV